MFQTKQKRKTYSYWTALNVLVGETAIILKKKLPHAVRKGYKKGKKGVHNPFKASRAEETSEGEKTF